MLLPSLCRHYVFFFQAEDGIRDGHVTGVQTCALPISGSSSVEPSETIPSQSGSDDIADDEFEALLDELHGKGRGPGSAPAASAPASQEPPASAPSSGDESTADDSITEDEFEALLDELHGKGKAPNAQPGTQPKTHASAPAQSAQPPTPAPQRGPAPAKPAASARAPKTTHENPRGEDRKSVV